MKYNFSIVIPSYNNLSLFKRAINSVLIQQNVSWELIVVDDSNINDIETYMSSFKEDNIKYFRNKQQFGAVRNWNYGLSKINGEYVILLHHDEAFYSELHLWNIKKAMENGMDIVIAKTYVFVNRKLYKRTRPNLCHSVFLHFPTLLFFMNQIGPCASFAFKRKDIKNFNEQLHWLVDVEWYYRMLKGKKVCVLDDFFHIQSSHNHAGQITKSLNINKALNDDIKILKHIYQHNILIKSFLYINQFITRQFFIRHLTQKILHKK